MQAGRGRPVSSRHVKKHAPPPYRRRRAANRGLRRERRMPSRRPPSQRLEIRTEREADLALVVGSLFGKPCFVFVHRSRLSPARSPGGGDATCPTPFISILTRCLRDGHTGPTSATRPAASSQRKIGGAATDIDRRTRGRQGASRGRGPAQVVTSEEASAGRQSASPLPPLSPRAPPTPP